MKGKEGGDTWAERLKVLNQLEEQAERDGKYD